MREYIIRNNEIGCIICKCDSFADALDTIVKFEDNDKFYGQFKKNAYDLDIIEKLDDETIKLVNDFARSMKQLSDHWFELSDKENDIISKDYPLEWNSFDEMATEAMHWAYLINKINLTKLK